jgi:hypothetical protein
MQDLQKRGVQLTEIFKMRFNGNILLILSIFLTGSVAHEWTALRPIVDTSWKTYSNLHLGFSLRFPANLSVKEFPDGLMLVDERLPGIDSNVLQVTNGPFPPKSTGNGVDYFNLFRKAKPNSALTKIGTDPGAYYKIEDSVVDSYAAVRLSYEYLNSERPQSPDWVGMELPSSRRLIVYINKGGVIWAITSFATDKKMHEERAKTLEQITSTFKFL